MIKKISNLLFLFTVIYSICVFSETKSTSTKKQELSSVELQWEETPGAFMYEVQILNSKGKQLKMFVSKSSLFKFQSTSGKIKIRGRLVDAYGKKGHWSPLIEAEVPPEDLKFPVNSDNKNPITAQASSKTSKGIVSLSWPSGIQAKRYKIKIYDKDNNLVQEKETPNLTEKFELDVGTFSYSITPIGNDQIPGKEIKAPTTIEIGAAQLSLEEFQVIESPEKKLEIKMPVRKNFEITGALEYANHMSETWTPVAEYTPFTEDIWTPDDKLKPGRYRIGFWITRKNWISSEKFYHQFVIKPTESEIEENTVIQ